MEKKKEKSGGTRFQIRIGITTIKTKTTKKKNTKSPGERRQDSSPEQKEAKTENYKNVVAVAKLLRRRHKMGRPEWVTQNAMHCTLCHYAMMSAVLRVCISDIR